MIASLLDEGLAITAVDYVAAKTWHREFRRQAAELLDDFDALMMPSTAHHGPGYARHHGHAALPSAVEPRPTARGQYPLRGCSRRHAGRHSACRATWTKRRICSAWPPGVSRPWGSTPCRPCGGASPDYSRSHTNPKRKRGLHNHLTSLTLRVSMGQRATELRDRE